MAIAIELETEWRSGGHPQIDQPIIGVDEVKIVMQALAAVRPHIGSGGSPCRARADRHRRLPSPK